MLTMQCAEIMQSVDNTMSRKRTGKINNWPPYSKIFQYIHVDHIYMYFAQYKY